MKRLEGNLPYLDSGSAARIEAPARLVATGETNINDLEAMGGGGDDPLKEYFKKIEGASPDWINNLFQWIEQEEQKGTRTVNHQGISLPLNNFKSRLEEVRARKQQIVPEAPTAIAGSRNALSLTDEVQALRSAWEDELQTKKKNEVEEALAQLRPEAISQRLRQVCIDVPAARESAELLEKARAPRLMSEVAAYLMSDKSNKGVDEIRDLSDDPPDSCYLFGRKFDTIKSNPKVSISPFYEEQTSLQRSREIFEGVSIEIRQTRIPRYVTERCSGITLLYPNKVGDKFWRREDVSHFTVDVRAGKIDGKLAVSVRGGGQSDNLFKPSETDIKRALVNILAGLKE